jgi:trehalose 6-phosphate phosphatase
LPLSDSIGFTGGHRLLAPLRRHPERAAVVCDIDGTLAPIVMNPEDASVPAPTRELLAELNSRYRLVACVSGRRAADARRVVGVDSLTYVGNHGLEHLEAGAEVAETDPAAAAKAPALRALALEQYTPELEQAGIRLEDKESIWSFHWRGAPDETVARAALDGVADAALERGLIPHWGRKVLEIRPPVRVDKGVALAGLLRGTGVESALYAGDDTTDLDAFRKLRELHSSRALDHVVSVGVRSAEGPEDLVTEADLVVDGPEGFSGVLAALA